MTIEHAPVNTAHLTRRQAKALIDSRLASLGHAPEFVSPDAAEALMARSSGAQGLLAALAATLFLASTEDVTLVGRMHVERAVPAPDIALSGAQPAMRHHWLRPFALVCLAAGIAVVCFAGWRLADHGRRPPESAPIAEHMAQTVVPPPRLPAPDIQPEQPQPAPPAIEPLPDAPPAMIRLAAHAADQDTQARLTDTKKRFLQAGIGRIDVQATTSPIACTSVCYFYAEDAALASNVAKLLSRVASFTAPASVTAPLLIIQVDGHSALPPGTIEVSVP